MKSLPLLLSVPHAGLRVPTELADRCLLTPAEIARDGDKGAAEIYLPLKTRVMGFVTTSIARAVLDMNRPEDDRSKDGVVKTHTCWDEEVWAAPLSASEIEGLFEEHHRPYHGALTAAAAAPEILLGVDAHTMAAVAPPVAPDPGAERPAACLSNADGTCPLEWLELMAAVLREHLGQVKINDPFRGGYITRHHAAEMPWLQLELSRTTATSAEEKRSAVIAALKALASTFD